MAVEMNRRALMGVWALWTLALVAIAIAWLVARNGFMIALPTLNGHLISVGFLAFGLLFIAFLPPLLFTAIWLVCRRVLRYRRRASR
jgi:hypothetical protein